MRNRRRYDRGVLCAAFGAGLLLACWCPKSWLIGLLALTVIVLGIAACKR